MSSDASRVIRALLSNSIDYAGLFPPAGLSMSEAAANYAQYLKSGEAWALGKFVLPVALLDEFATAAKEHLPNSSTIPAWSLSVLAGSDLGNDLQRILKFNRDHQKIAHIDAVELKASSRQEITSAMSVIPKSFETYFEIPIQNNPVELIATISQVGARAKVRTGGITIDAFPASADLISFIDTCVRIHVVFKATAGLHHPIRARYRLTYEEKSTWGMMYGFLNVFLAAVFLTRGMEQEDAVKLLEEQSRQAFHFHNDGVGWRGHEIWIDDLVGMRQRVAASFGSCSFSEPIGDLHTLHFL